MKKPKRVTKNKRKKVIKVKKGVDKAMWVDIPKFKYTIDSLLNKTAEGYMMYTTVPEIRDNLSLEDQQRIYDGTTVLSACHDKLSTIEETMPTKRGVVPDYQYPVYLDMHSNLSDVHDLLLNDAVLPLAELSERATSHLRAGAVNEGTVEDTHDTETEVVTDTHDTETEVVTDTHDTETEVVTDTHDTDTHDTETEVVTDEQR